MVTAETTGDDWTGKRGTSEQRGGVVCWGGGIGVCVCVCVCVCVRQRGGGGVRATSISADG